MYAQKTNDEGTSRSKKYDVKYTVILTYEKDRGRCVGWSSRAVGKIFFLYIKGKKKEEIWFVFFVD